MNFSVTGNDIVEQRRLLWNLRCLSSGSDLLYLQFKPTICAIYFFSWEGFWVGWRKWLCLVRKV